MTDQSTALATLANISDLIEGRDQSIALWIKARDDFHATTKAASLASIGGGIGLNIPYGHRYEESELARAFISEATHDEECPVTRQRTTISAREHFEQLITAEVDRRCWRGLMENLGFDQLLDRQAREEFRESIKGTPPVFNEENCRATFGHIWSNRRDIYLRGVANVFMALDRRFRSHDAFEIGHRVIIENALSEYGSWNSYNREETLFDIERIFRELEELPPLTRQASITSEVTRLWRIQATPFVIEGDYFRIRVFGNGNLHLWFTRKDLLAEVNKLLLEYYRPVEGEAGEGPSYESRPRNHVTQAKNFGEFFTPANVAERIFDRYAYGIAEGMRVLEPSAGKGALASLAAKKGAIVDCIEIQPGHAHELILSGLYRDVECRDFLEKQPPLDPNRLYDAIVANPPFDKGRDVSHVLHMWEFLRPGGMLVAIMSARAEFCQDKRHKALHDLIATAEPVHGRMVWHDLPERSFSDSGTNVNTVVLAIRKKRTY